MLKRILNIIGLDTANNKSQLKGINPSPSTKHKEMVISRNQPPAILSQTELTNIPLNNIQSQISYSQPRQQLCHHIENMSLQEINSQISNIRFALADMNDEVAEYRCLDYKQYSNDKTYQLLKFQQEQLTAKLKLLQIKKRDMLLY